jgi:ABC-type polysaccharide/polyol phosphate export permease
MFSTPIFYPALMVESKGFGWMLDVNPMYWLIDSYREVLMYGSWPDWGLVATAAAVGAGFLLLGSRFFLAQKPRFPDLL